MTFPNSLLILAQAVLSCSTACKSLSAGLLPVISCGLGAAGPAIVVLIQLCFWSFKIVENPYIAYDERPLFHQKVTKKLLTRTPPASRKVVVPIPALREL